MDRFQIAIDKVEKLQKEVKDQKDYFFIKDGFKNIKLVFEDILFVKGSGNYLDILIPEKTYSPRMSFSELVNILPVKQFMRVHQSYIISIPHILKIENNHVHVSTHKIPISNGYKDVVFKRLELK